MLSKLPQCHSRWQGLHSQSVHTKLALTARDDHVIT
jgi:hypothetical protein